MVPGILVPWVQLTILYLSNCYVYLRLIGYSWFAYWTGDDDVQEIEMLILIYQVMANRMTLVGY